MKTEARNTDTVPKRKNHLEHKRRVIPSLAEYLLIMVYLKKGGWKRPAK